MGSSILKSASLSNGGQLQAIKPIANSVSGSPFTVGTTAQVTGDINAPAILVYASESVHIRFSKDGTLATSSNMVIPGGQLCVFSVDPSDRVSFLRAGLEDANVWVEAGATQGND